MADKMNTMEIERAIDVMLRFSTNKLCPPYLSNLIKGCMEIVQEVLSETTK